jgi:hypothetical protein
MCIGQHNGADALLALMVPGAGHVTIGEAASS